MRIPIEGKFGKGKRCHALDRLSTKLEETSESSIMISFIVMNLERFGRDRARSFIFVLYYSIRSLQGYVRRLLLGCFQGYGRRDFWTLSPKVAEMA
ncbi:MAG: transposase [Syntrophales bacterium]